MNIDMIKNINMKIKNIAVSFLFILIFAVGCDSMDDNYKEYIGEYNYSGKIQNIRAYLGYERVVLAWDNPKDQKSKNIRIVYGVDSTVVDYESMVDSVSIDGLTDGTGYEFTVYTLDAHKNVSVPVNITAFPISNEFVESLTAPTLVVDVKDNKQVLTLLGLSNIQMTFAGIINLDIEGPDGFRAIKKIDITDQVTGLDDDGMPKNKVLSEYSIPVEELGVEFLVPAEHTFKYSVNVWPVMGNLISVDEVELSREAKVNVPPVIVSLSSFITKITDQYNTTGNEGVDKVGDGNIDTKYLTVNKTTWIQFEASKEILVTRYSLTSGNDAATRDPKKWRIEGSNDGSVWTKLDSQADYKFINRKQTDIFEIVNETPYKYYRMTVEENNGDNLFQMTEWTLYGPKLE